MVLSSHFSGEIFGCAVDPTGQHFVTCGGDKTIRKWDYAGRQMVMGTKEFKDDVCAIDWANDGK